MQTGSPKSTSMEGRSYRVIPRAADGFRLNKKAPERFYVRTTGNKPILLSTVITLDQRVEPNSLTQYQQLNCTSIQGMLMPPKEITLYLKPA